LAASGSQVVKNILLATAAQIELDGTIKLIEAAVIRGEIAVQQGLRERAHDLLDSLIDIKVENMKNALDADSKTDI
jgi:hypothetical protein